MSDLESFPLQQENKESESSISPNEFTEIGAKKVSLEKQINEITTDTMNRQVDLISGINTSLADFGINTENIVPIEPKEFLEFVLLNRGSLMPRVPEETPIEDLKVGDGFSIELKESEGSNIIGGDTLAFCSFLAQRGIDIVHVDSGVLETLLRSKILNDFLTLRDETYRSNKKINLLLQEEHNLETPVLKHNFRELAESMSVENPTAKTFEELQKVLDSYLNVSNRFENISYSLIPEFEELINHKKTMSPESVGVLNTFLEKNEELIFEVLGQDYFFKIQEKHDDFESAYAEMFGYSNREIWERRSRNWKEVNAYLTSNLLNRGYLTVGDLREIHNISTRGVLPFFCKGFRYDKEVNLHQADHYKEEVTIGTDVSTTKVYELEESLNLLVEKANKLVKSNYPQVMLEIQMGNLFSEYASIHPHPDGNGTNAVFFIEALKVLRGNYIPPEKYDPVFITRVRDALNKNDLACAIAYLKLKVFEINNRNKRT